MTRLDDDEIARNRGGSSSDTRRAAALAFAREVALTRGKVDDRALAADPISAYGSVTVLNRPVGDELGAKIAEQFVP